MNTIYTAIDELLKEHINESFEMSELSDSPVMAITVKDSVLSWQGDVTELQAKYIIDGYKFRELMPSLGLDFTVIGYVEGREFFVFSVFMDGEDKEMLPQRRAAFMEFFNGNTLGVKLRHVPVLPVVLTLPQAKKALETSKYELVRKYTTNSIVELCAGISPMTKKERKGLVFKSIETGWSFKSYSEGYMYSGMSSLGGIGGLGMMGSV